MRNSAVPEAILEQTPPQSVYFKTDVGSVAWHVTSLKNGSFILAQTLAKTHMNGSIAVHRRHAVSKAALPFLPIRRCIDSWLSGKVVPLQPHRDAAAGHVFFDLADGEFAEVEDAGRQHGVGFAL